jgi:uncharacterized protein YdaU (DUF1376 family)
MLLDNGGPPLDDAAPKLRWIKLNIAEFLEGIDELTYEQRGFYITALLKMYARHDGIPVDDRAGAHAMGCNPRTFRVHKAMLLEAGKFYVADGMLRNKRFDYELAEFTRQAKRRREAAIKRERERRDAITAYATKQRSAPIRAEFEPNSSPIRAEFTPNSAPKNEENPTKSTCAVQQVWGEPELEPELEPRKKDTKQRSDTTPAAAPLSLDELENKLLDACNGALANPCNSQGLLNLAIPQMWLNAGADLDLDVIPTLRAIGKRDHGKGIASWSYFTKAVADTAARRRAGMPSGHVGKHSKPQIRRFAR